MRKYITILLIVFVQMTFAANEADHLHLNNFGYESFEQASKEKVIITPNPARSNTVIKIMDNDAQVIQVSIYSLLGNQIFSKNYSQRENTIGLNVQPFKKGKYLIKITFDDGSTEVKALIKQ